LEEDLPHGISCRQGIRASHSALLRMSEQAPFCLYTTFAFPFLLLLNTGSAGIIILAVAIIIAIPHAMRYGPQSSYIAENFPTGLASGGSGLGYQAVSLITGGPGPLLAAWCYPTSASRRSACTSLPACC
jgi:hypothetical protein